MLQFPIQSEDKSMIEQLHQNFLQYLENQKINYRRYTMERD